MLMQPSAIADTSRSPSFLRASMVTIAPWRKGREIRRGRSGSQSTIWSHRRGVPADTMGLFPWSGFGRDLRRERLVRGFRVDQRIDVELCRDDVGPLVEDPVQRLVARDLEH